MDRATNQIDLFEEEAPPASAWEAQAARMDALTNRDFVGYHMARTIAAIQSIARAGHLLRLAFSSGKDSTVLASLALEALFRMRTAGELTPAIYLVSADTGIENPEIVHLRVMHHLAFIARAKELGIEAISQIARPRLSERWWVGIIGGTALPSFYDTKADCSTDLKISGMSRLARECDRELAASGSLPSVTLVGTRFDESDHRRSAMTARGESHATPRVSSVGGHDCLTLSPICDWPTETVWAFLQRAGIGKEYPGYLKDYSETWSIYDAASAGECVVYGEANTKRGSGCGARHGCMTCLRVQNDKSLENMMLLGEYQYLRPMLELRTYLMNVRFDLERRRWLSRRVDGEGDGLMVVPNTYSAAECARLLRMVLTIDMRERRRAAKVAAQLEAGRIPRTAHNERMSLPQFKNLSFDDLLGIDYAWSLNVMAPTHAALRIAKEVWDGTGEMDVPKVAPFPRVKIPAPIPILPDPSLWRSQMGSRDALQEMMRCESIESKVPWRDETTWSIDGESAALFFDLEMDRRLEETKGQGPEHGLAAAEYYLRMGIVAYPAKGRSLLDRMKRRAGYLAMMGFAGEAADGSRALETLAKLQAATA